MGGDGEADNPSSRASGWIAGGAAHRSGDRARRHLQIEHRCPGGATARPQGILVGRVRDCDRGPNRNSVSGGGQDGHQPIGCTLLLLLGSFNFIR